MPHELIVFTDPPNALVQLIHDSGYSAVAIPVTHASGRPGQGISIPDTVPNNNGCELRISADGKVTLKQRAILIYNQSYAYLMTDDFYLSDTPSEVTPPNPPAEGPPNAQDPAGIINWVYASGSYDLSTHDGCGLFTEACTTALHDWNNQMWGHIKKTGAQNQYNGHAVDALQCLAGPFAGIWDIVHDSVSPNATPAFNYKGIPDPALWYYPA
jgi:hypothetical protein